MDMSGRLILQFLYRIAPVGGGGGRTGRIPMSRIARATGVSLRTVQRQMLALLQGGHVQVWNDASRCARTPGPRESVSGHGRGRAGVPRDIEYYLPSPSADRIVVDSYIQSALAKVSAGTNTSPGSDRALVKEIQSLRHDCRLLTARINDLLLKMGGDDVPRQAINDPRHVN